MDATNDEVLKKLTNSLPESVGIWIELDAATLQICFGEGSIRWLRYFIKGIDELPVVKEIIIPCTDQSAPVMKQLFAESRHCGDDDCLISKKLHVKAFLLEDSCADMWREWLGKEIANLENQLDNLGKQLGSKRILKQVFREISGKPRTPRLLMKRVALGVICIKDLALRRLLLILRRWITPKNYPFDRLAVKAGEAFPGTSWIIVNPQWKNSSIFEGRKIVAIPDLVYREFQLDGFTEQEIQTHTKAVCEVAAAADKIICFSSHVVHQQIAGLLADRDSDKIRVVPHAPILPDSFADSENDSRAQLGNELRQFFSSEQVHRYYCDFPFERMRYVLVSSQVRPYKNYKRLLKAFDAILRRHRRNIKLVVTGDLNSNEDLLLFLQERGLVFDVIQAINLKENLHTRLIRHAELIVIPTLFEGGMPFGFAEAVGMGSPCAFSRIPAFMESLTGQELAGPEVFNPQESGSIEQSVLYVLDHRDEILKRQQMIVERLSQRTWANVAEEFLSY